MKQQTLPFLPLGLEMRFRTTGRKHVLGRLYALHLGADLCLTQALAASEERARELCMDWLAGVDVSEEISRKYAAWCAREGRSDGDRETGTERQGAQGW